MKANKVNFIYPINVLLPIQYMKLKIVGGLYPLMLALKMVEREPPVKKCDL